MIIGFTGYARSGKDTAAKTLLETQHFQRIAFADAIRTTLLSLNPLISDGLRLAEIVSQYDWEVAKSYPEGRRLLQTLGVEMRLNDPDIWVKAAFKGLQLDHPASKVVVTDVRFPNEADYIRKLGGHIIRVVRPGYGPINDHISERAMDEYECDLTLINDTSLEELSKMTRAFYTALST